jgi:hypothetical protein
MAQVVLNGLRLDLMFDFRHEEHVEVVTTREPRWARFEGRQQDRAGHDRRMTEQNRTGRG